MTHRITIAATGSYEHPKAEDVAASVREAVEHAFLCRGFTNVTALVSCIPEQVSPQAERNEERTPMADETTTDPTTDAAAPPPDPNAPPMSGQSGDQVPVGGDAAE